MSHKCVPWHVCNSKAGPGKTDLACSYIETKYAQVLEILALKQVSTSKYKVILKLFFSFFRREMARRERNPTE